MLGSPPFLPPPRPLPYPQVGGREGAARRRSDSHSGEEEEATRRAIESARRSDRRREEIDLGWPLWHPAHCQRHQRWRSQTTQYHPLQDDFPVVTASATKGGGVRQRSTILCRTTSRSSLPAPPDVCVTGSCRAGGDVEVVSQPGNDLPGHTDRWDVKWPVGIWVTILCRARSCAPPLFLPLATPSGCALLRAQRRSHPHRFAMLTPLQ